MQSRMLKTGLALAAAATLGAAPAKGPMSWLGRYEVQFENSLVSGERYTALNVMELAAYSPSAAYLGLELEFYNGHQCAFHGVVDVEGDHFVYHQKDGSDPPCALTLSRKGRKMVVNDPNGACTMQGCGARGTLDGIDFPVSAGRTVRYSPRLQDSEAYKAAVAEYEKR
jgi:hypothetical protein